LKAIEDLKPFSRLLLRILFDLVEKGGGGGGIIWGMFFTIFEDKAKIFINTGVC